MNTGYFFCADILGFKRIINSLTSEVLQEKINDWVSLITKIAGQSDITKYQLIS